MARKGWLYLFSSVLLKIYTLNYVSQTGGLTEQSLYDGLGDILDPCNNTMESVEETETRAECGLRCLARKCGVFRLAAREDGGYFCHTSGNFTGLDERVWNTFKQSDVAPEGSALISGPDNSIPDAAISVSSAFVQVTAGDHGPQCSRLGVPRPPSCYCEAWAAGSGAVGEWIQADLGTTFIITAVATAGRGMDHGGVAKHMRVTSYKMGAMCQGGNVKYYMEGGQEKVFVGNLEDLVIVKHDLQPAMLGRYIRVYPQTWNGYMCLRWELYGINAN